MKAGRAKQGAAENYRDLLLYANRRAERIFEVATAARSLERRAGKWEQTAEDQTREARREGQTRQAE